MYILGIESSCDETSIAIIEFEKENNNFKVLANTVSSQIDIHKAFGGVVPEIASRQHVKNIGWVLDEALATANIKLEDISAVAVTVGPGLVGALLVGVSFAKALAYSLPQINNSKRCVKRGSFGSFLASGLISTGWPKINVGSTIVSSTYFSKKALTICPNPK
jgi:hypothetical protein